MTQKNAQSCEKPDLFAEFCSEPKRCKLAKIIAELDDTHAEAVGKALATEAIPASKIAHVLTGWGHPVSEKTVRPHRDGSCCCAG